MKIIAHSKISSRFARRILLLASFGLSIIFIIILSITIVRNISFVSIQIQPVTTSPNRTIRHLPIADGKSVLPLIYQPEKNSKVLRALLTFYPNDQKQTFQSEFRWFFLSWTEMMKNESSLWRTDLIVYTTDYESMFKDLNCLINQIRTTADEPPRCRVFSYIRIKDRKSTHESTTSYQNNDRQRSRLLHQHLSNYGYIDSINTVFEYYPSYSMYDFILRTDLDCFLTENFAQYVPYEETVIVGRGGYSTNFNSKRLERIANDMNWTYANKSGLGSTWYGSPSMIYHLANCTLDAMLHLSMNEFTTPEREQKLGVMLWPEWHYGVLLLYGGHLAINHLMIHAKYNIGIADQLLDQGVTSKDQNDLRNSHRLHLHCWHGHEAFSKFDFKDGKYNHIQPSSLINDTSASGLAMRFALESKSMTLEQLKQRLIDIKK